MNFLFNFEDSARPQIDELDYLPNFIARDEQSVLIELIDQQPWLSDLKRRAQHYGYKYDYKARTITPDSYLGALPEWLQSIAKKLPFTPDQAIVNEYLPGQGTSAHVDCEPCFSNTIASLSLGSAATMQFTKDNHKKEIYLWGLTDHDLKRVSQQPWYLESGSGMGATLNIAINKNAYTLADRGTWIRFGNKSDFEILFEGGEELFNPYGLILVNPKKHPHVNVVDGQALIDWLIGEEGQQRINSYRINGKQLFFANAK